MKTSDFDYKLPHELIAQQPAPERTQARMMVVRRDTGSIVHRRFSDLPDLLRPADLIVVNNTRVFPARVFGYKEETGGHVEILFIEETAEKTWEAFVRASRAPRVGSRLSLASGRIRAQVLALRANGRVLLKLSYEGRLSDILDEKGVSPLPPYIKRPCPGTSPDNATQRTFDLNRYQTVYAQVNGTVAAPTAGFHFSVELLNTLKQQGILCTSITLHVGPGTFTPIKTENVEQHQMESERFSISPEAARMIGDTLTGKGRIIAVGSTVVRTLETVVSEYGSVVAAKDRTSLFIYPPYTFRVVDVMLTNFHLPASTLLMMVSAFAGVELSRRAYQLAIQERYRFYSYGDCMLIV